MTQFLNANLDDSYLHKENDSNVERLTYLAATLDQDQSHAKKLFKTATC